MSALKVAHKPMLAPQGLDARKVAAGEGFALYMINPAANNSKFYEGIMLSNDDGTWRVHLRWGALTDSGFTGRIDGANFDGKFSRLTEREAKGVLTSKYRAKTGKGYIDVWGPRHKSPDGKQLPKGQYPVGLKRDVGFGWGVQEAAFCIPALRALAGELLQAQDALNSMQFADASEFLDSAASTAKFQIRSVDSSMAKKINDNIAHMQGRASKLLAGEFDSNSVRDWKTALSRLMSYIDKQLSVCHGKVAAAGFDPKDIGKIKSPTGDPDEMRIVKDTDQRWFSEMQEEAASPGTPWDGDGPAPDPNKRVMRLAARLVASKQPRSQVERVARRWMAAYTRG